MKLSIKYQKREKQTNKQKQKTNDYGKSSLVNEISHLLEEEPYPFTFTLLTRIVKINKGIKNKLCKKDKDED